MAQELLHETPERLGFVRDRSHLWRARAAQEPRGVDGILVQVDRGVRGVRRKWGLVGMAPV
jgi:hypothetical protein